MRMHDLRHACVSLLAAQAVDLKTIAEIVGHSDVRLTQAVYQHTFSEAKRSAVEKLGDALSPVATKSGAFELELGVSCWEAGATRRD
jgi:integrase